MSDVKKFVKDNGLLLTFAGLFLLCLAGQVLSGKALYDGTQAAHGLPQVGYGKYVRTGDFLQGIFSNWQAAVLQLGSLILFGVVLHQKGTPHAKKEGNQGQAVGEGSSPKADPRDSWLKRNSLSLAFGVMFVLAFVGHWLSGAASYNSELALLHEPQMSRVAFLGSAKFWFSTMQTWEAEYAAIAIYVFLSIFLRQEGSPESKPTDATNDDTGDPNK
jgi:hypothetical protein